MARSVVRGTPYNHISGAQNRGIRAGEPKGSDGQTTMQQYRGTGMDTAQSARGTPYHSQAGNPDEASREVVRTTMPHSDDHGNQNDPRSNGPTTLLDVSSLESGSVAKREATMDSPVPGDAPRFEPGWIADENRAHLGTGNEGATEGLVATGGVMSRGMLGISKASDKDEGALTKDDTLPELPAAAKVGGDGGDYIVTGKFGK